MLAAGEEFESPVAAGGRARIVERDQRREGRKGRTLRSRTSPRHTRTPGQVRRGRRSHPVEPRQGRGASTWRFADSTGGPGAAYPPSCGPGGGPEAPNRLRVRTSDCAVESEGAIAATPATSMMSATGSMTPLAAWRSEPVLDAMGTVAGRVLDVGKVQLTGTTSNRQHLDANPLRIWYVTTSYAVVEGEDLGPVGPLAEQAHMADISFPHAAYSPLAECSSAPSNRPAPRPSRSLHRRDPIVRRG